MSGDTLSPLRIPISFKLVVLWSISRSRVWRCVSDRPVVDTAVCSGQPVHVLIINLVKQRLSVCINRLPAGISQLLVLINARYFVLMWPVNSGLVEKILPYTTGSLFDAGITMKTIIVHVWNLHCTIFNINCIDLIYK